MSSERIRDARDQMWKLTIMLHKIRMELGDVMPSVDSEEWLYDYERPLMGVMFRLDRLANRMGPGDE